MNESPWVLVTNDDGIEAPGIRGLVCGLHEAGISTVVVAPARNQSATGMRLTLGKPMEVVIREDLKHTWGLNGPAAVHLIQLDGTPCDCAIVALDGGLDHLLPGITPSMMVSGINLGPNLSQDSYHSGTMAAAREAGLYGLPAIAASLSSFQIDGMDRAVEATLEIVLRALGTVPNIPVDLLRRGSNTKGDHRSNWPEGGQRPWSEDPRAAAMEAFLLGDLMINLNVPPTWTGDWSTTRLGSRWYLNAVQWSEEGATFTIGGADVHHLPSDRGDCDADQAGHASVSCLPTWPQTHPLALDEGLLAWILDHPGPDGLPSILEPSSR